MDFIQFVCLCCVWHFFLCCVMHSEMLFYVSKNPPHPPYDGQRASPFFLLLKRGLLPNKALPYDSHPVAHRMSRATIDSGGHTRYRGGLNGQRTSGNPTHSDG